MGPDWLSKAQRQPVEWPDYYGDLTLTVIAPKYYYPERRKSDKYSDLIRKSKTEDLSDVFLKKLVAVFGDKLPDDPDLIVVVPGSQTNSFSPTLLELGKKLSSHYNVPNENILTRTCATKKQSYCKTKDERHKAVSGTIGLREPVKTNLSKYQRALLLDDIRTTGMTLLECAKVLKGVGIKDFIAVCLGINAPKDK